MKEGQEAGELVVVEKAAAWQAKIVFVAEAYDGSERERFLSDVARLTSEVLSAEDAPFKFLRPFLCVEAIWVASARSGVPRVDAASFVKRNNATTAFGLFRSNDAPVRLVEPSRASYARARRVCRLSTDCDRKKTLIVLLANDPYYGGLGDEIIIATNSETSGALALRHELGHALGDIGEEYDGGDDYSGANFALEPRACERNDVAKKVYDRLRYPCAPWLSESVKAAKGALALATWPWRRPPFLMNFHVPPSLPSATLEFSVAGGLDVLLEIDDQPLETTFKTPPTLDRRFASLQLDLSPGHHTLAITEETSPHFSIKSHDWQPAPLLCHLQLHLEEDDSHEDIGLYPLFAEATGPIVGYRPTRSGCLMRDVTSNHLCPVCRDLLLRRLLDATKPLQQLQVGVTSIETHLQPLLDVGAVELLWTKRKETKKNLATLREPGCWDLRATFRSPHLRRVKPDVLEATTRIYLGTDARAKTDCDEKEHSTRWVYDDFKEPPASSYLRVALLFPVVALLLFRRPLRLFFLRLLRRSSTILPSSSPSTKAG